jgi:hypothetical protein
LVEKIATQVATTPQEIITAFAPAGKTSTFLKIYTPIGVLKKLMRGK